MSLASNAFTMTRCARSPCAPRPSLSRRSHVVRAEDDDEFEARLAKLNKATVPRSVIKKEAKPDASGDSKTISKPKVKVDYSDEVLWREFSPSSADLAFNLVMAASLIWIPLTISAIGRCAFVKYRVTNKRIVVEANAPWKKEESNVGYHEVATVKGINRGFGAWGDMVITLDGGEKLELRSVPGWQEVRDYIVEQRDAVRGKDISQADLLSGKASSPKPKGFSS